MRPLGVGSGYTKEEPQAIYCDASRLTHCRYSVLQTTNYFILRLNFGYTMHRYSQPRYASLVYPRLHQHTPAQSLGLCTSRTTLSPEVRRLTTRR
jgi:hypothetical protein